MLHIIFDLDGTLIDSKNEIVRTYKAVFEEVRPLRPVDPESLNYGMTINDMLTGVYGEDKSKIASARQLFSSMYDTSDYLETSFYEGVEETLKALKQEGHKLYIATNKRYVPTMRILQAKKVLDLFSAIAANEQQPGVTPTKREMIAALKQEGAFTHGMMVGDSTGDVVAGNEEGLITIAVTYGYEKASVLAEKKPTYLIDRFHNLSNFVQIHNKL